MKNEMGRERTGRGYSRGVCVVDGCGRPHRARGWCITHYTRWQKFGDPLETEVVRPRQRGAVINYDGMHARLRRGLGPATSYTCRNCDRTAHDWAYDGLDPDELIGDAGLDHPGRRYSVNLDHYMPLCKACHRRLDFGTGQCAIKKCSSIPTWRGHCAEHVGRWEECAIENCDMPQRSHRSGVCTRHHRLKLAV